MTKEQRFNTNWEDIKKNIRNSIYSFNNHVTSPQRQIVDTEINTYLDQLQKRYEELEEIERLYNRTM